MPAPAAAMASEGFLVADRRRLEFTWHGPRPEAGPEVGPTLVFLHDGTGCISTWKDFPRRLGEATGLGVFCYSRAGYGGSDPAVLPRTTRYMHHEAQTVLPQVLTGAGIGEVVLVGHSDGASIALIHAGGRAEGLRALLLVAPHVFAEELSMAGIRRAAEDYRTTDLRERLARHHGKGVDEAFWGWNDIWLHPDFRHWNIEDTLAPIRVPTLLIQGAADEYGTLAQLERIESGISGPVERVMIPACGHSPHLAEAQATLDAMTEFLSSRPWG